MAKKTEKGANDTSYHGTVINLTVNELTRIMGEPQFDVREWNKRFTDDTWDGGKVTVEWTCENKDGDVFTIYDWKEYRHFFDDDTITWHIGGHSKKVTEQALKEFGSFKTSLKRL